jgi:hypothetical protein
MGRSRTFDELVDLDGARREPEGKRDQHPHPVFRAHENMVVFERAQGVEEGLICARLFLLPS